MQIAKISLVAFVVFGLVVVSGCEDELKDCRIQNDFQRTQIAELESKVQSTELQLQQLRQQLRTAQNVGGAEVDALRQTIAALEKDLSDKKSLIASMQEQLLLGGAKLPVELSTMLEDFAKQEDMVTFDPSSGIVKFKSDLLFKSGSDEVQPTAGEAVKVLCGILNSEQGQQFDIIIGGHTDDQPIRYSRGKHPSNWHLSAHRAIAVLNMMAANNIDSKRTSIRGFGEFRPFVPNESGKRGHKQNRRVEIFIVPKGT